MKEITRRAALSRAGIVLAGVASQAARSQDQKTGKSGKFKVMTVGAHPDDPESSCGGTMARYADLGHEVVTVYLTRGEGGISGKSEAEAAAIRTAEAERACAILKTRAVFAGQIDGKTEISGKRYQDFAALIDAERPDVLFAPWPIDSHRDHRAASLLSYDAWERAGRRFELYYTEVDLGAQTKNFQPTHYVDITAVVDRKRQACYAHQSQNPASFYIGYHEPMQRLRGLEFNCRHAEAFVRASQNPQRFNLPG